MSLEPPDQWLLPLSLPFIEYPSFLEIPIRNRTGSHAPHHRTIDTRL